MTAIGEEVVLGIDVGGTNLRMGFINRNYDLKNFTIESTQQVFNGNNPLEIVKSTINNFIEKFLGEKQLAAISVGFPSTIDKTRRKVTSSPNVKSLQNLEVSDSLENSFGIPVFVNRDVNFLFEYDMLKNNLDTSGTILGFYVGTGFGNAISIKGNLLLGKNGVAAELGHIPALNNHNICGCGNQGCIETIASGIYLEKLRKEHFGDTPIQELFTVHGEEPQLIEFIDGISMPIATEINIFDPDYVIIGGGVTQMPDFPMDLLLEKIKLHTRKPYPEQNLSIIFSEPNQENGVIGAGIYGFKRLARKEYL